MAVMLGAVLHYITIQIMTKVCNFHLFVHIHNEQWFFKLVLGEIFALSRYFEFLLEKFYLGVSADRFENHRHVALKSQLLVLNNRRLW